ncbi:hypothetical protein RRG08_018170 [Elysia crispata]|uniref:Uncharacterized protein n=1 Tax=Elysia crispata TaxID=231223 RepID=A0AAE1DXT8_9GAST|nr:hypothetical protein RRG08_018170 [Elysia crispata]
MKAQSSRGEVMTPGYHHPRLCLASAVASIPQGSRAAMVCHHSEVRTLGGPQVGFSKQPVKLKGLGPNTECLHWLSPTRVAAQPSSKLPGKPDGRLRTGALDGTKSERTS